METVMGHLSCPRALPRGSENLTKNLDVQSMDTNSIIFVSQAVSADEATTVNVWLAVHEDGISVLDHTSMQFQVRYPYDSIVTFGGCQDDFMLVVTSDQMPASTADRISGDASSSTVKLLFQTRKPEVRKT